jgi:hypothetical protein
MTVKKKITIHWGDYAENHKGILPETYEFVKRRLNLRRFSTAPKRRPSAIFYVIEDGGCCDLCGCDAHGQTAESGDGGGDEQASK